jgi:hypothetical protein
VARVRKRVLSFIKDTLSIKSLLRDIGKESEKTKTFAPRGPLEEWQVEEEFKLESDSDYQYDQPIDGRNRHQENNSLFKK